VVQLGEGCLAEIGLTAARPRSRGVNLSCTIPNGDVHRVFFSRKKSGRCRPVAEIIRWGSEMVERAFGCSILGVVTFLRSETLAALSQIIELFAPIVVNAINWSDRNSFSSNILLSFETVSLVLKQAQLHRSNLMITSSEPHLMIRIADSAGWDRRTSRKLLLVKVYTMREPYSSQHPNPEGGTRNHPLYHSR
jgi:hypothetical protein